MNTLLPFYIEDAFYIQTREMFVIYSYNHNYHTVIDVEENYNTLQAILKKENYKSEYKDLSVKL